MFLVEICCGFTEADGVFLWNCVFDRDLLVVLLYFYCLIVGVLDTGYDWDHIDVVMTVCCCLNVMYLWQCLGAKSVDFAVSVKKNYLWAILYLVSKVLSFMYPPLYIVFVPVSKQICI